MRSRPCRLLPQEGGNPLSDFGFLQRWRPNLAAVAEPLPGPLSSDAVDPPQARPQARVSVIIPTLNEARNLPYVLPHIPRDTHEVILVDGDSVDGTVEVARSLLPVSYTHLPLPATRE